MYCRGYENAKEAGDKENLDVFFGFEYQYGWAHFTVYGLSPEWLYANEGIMEWSPEAFFAKAHEDGALIVHAHPFRDRIQKVILFPGLVDAIEINASQSDEANRRAELYAQMLGLPLTCGSDIHTVLCDRLAALDSAIRLTVPADLRAAILNGDTKITRIDLKAPPYTQ